MSNAFIRCPLRKDMIAIEVCDLTLKKRGCDFRVCRMPRLIAHWSKKLKDGVASSPGIWAGCLSKDSVVLEGQTGYFSKEEDASWLSSRRKGGSRARNRKPNRR